jgi:hypothetical protein
MNKEEAFFEIIGCWTDWIADIEKACRTVEIPPVSEDLKEKFMAAHTLAKEVDAECARLIWAVWDGLCAWNAVYRVGGASGYGAGAKLFHSKWYEMVRYVDEKRKEYRNNEQ